MAKREPVICRCGRIVTFSQETIGPGMAYATVAAWEASGGRYGVMTTGECEVCYKAKTRKPPRRA